MKTLNQITDWKEMINEVMLADCFEAMKLIPEKSIQLIIFDPPYFEVKGDFDFVFNNRDEWIELNRTCAKEFKRILADNGSLYVFGHAKKIAYQQVVYDEFFKLENSLVWWKYDAQTNKGYQTFRSYMPVTERILFYSNEFDKTGLEKIKHDFGSEFTPYGKIIAYEKNKLNLSNKDIAKLFPSKTGGLTGCVSNWIQGQNIPTPEQWGKICNLFGIEDKYKELRKEYKELRRPWNNEKKLTDILRYSQESHITGKFQHPTQKPPKLIEDLILCSSRKGDLVLDPMMGAWTTARACKDLWRDFIGFELEKEFCEKGEKRLEQEVLF